MTSEAFKKHIPDRIKPYGSNEGIYLAVAIGDGTVGFDLSPGMARRLREELDVQLKQAGHDTSPDGKDALVNAVATIASFYQWLDMIDSAGGATCVAGIAKTHAFLKSMRNNRTRVDTLIMEPARRAISQ